MPNVKTGRPLSLKPCSNIHELEVTLARYFLTLKVNERILSIRGLSEDTRMSIGAVAGAIRKMEETGAVSIEKRGHMGSYLTGVSLGQLWKLLDQGPLVIASGLPMHSRFDGLATGLKAAFESAGIEAYLIFIRGAETRLKALMDSRCHAVLMSGLSTQILNLAEHEIFLMLPPTSWLSGYCVYYREEPVNSARPFRVGVDNKSYDAKTLTGLEFAGQNVEFIPISYVRIAESLEKGIIDAIIWNTDQAGYMVSPEISRRPPSGHVSKITENKAISAVLVGKKGEDVIRSILQASIHVDQLMEIQRLVVENKMIPEY